MKEEYPRLYERSRMTNLDMPSPYQAGIFDTIVAENPDVTWASML